MPSFDHSRYGHFLSLVRPLFHVEHSCPILLLFHVEHSHTAARSPESGRAIPLSTDSRSAHAGPICINSRCSSTHRRPIEDHYPFRRCHLESLRWTLATIPRAPSGTSRTLIGCQFDSRRAVPEYPGIGRRISLLRVADLHPHWLCSLGVLWLCSLCGSPDGTR